MDKKQFTCPRCCRTTEHSFFFDPPVSIYNKEIRICHECEIDEVLIKDGHLEQTAQDFKFREVYCKE